MRYRTILAAAFLVLCLAVVGYIVARVRPVPVKQGFTLHITQTVYPPNEAVPIITATKVRQQKSDGSWRAETTYSNGRTDVGFGQPGRGVFHVDDKNQKLDYLSESSGRGVSEVDWTKQPGFAGEETILGYKTFHMHWEENGEYSDSYMCPALQGYPLKLISGNARNKTVIEATQVILGEPLFEAVANYPVDKKRYEQTHKE